MTGKKTQTEQVKLYNGEVILKFNPDRHMYWVIENGKDVNVDGVTGILGVIDKPWMGGWVAKMCGEFVVKNLKVGQILDEIQLQTFVKEMKVAHRKRATEAADVGTLVHEWIEKSIKGEKPPKPINEQILNGVNAWRQFVKKEGYKFILSEQKIYSRIGKFAGTLDFTARNKKGELVLGDIKTSNFFDPQMFWQVSAYQMAREEEFPKEKYDKQVIVRCGKDGVLEVQESYDYAKDILAFKGARLIRSRMKELKDLEIKRS